MRRDTNTAAVPGTNRALTARSNPRGPHPRRRDHPFHLSLRSPCTAVPAGLRTFIQTGHGPDR
jgi:hypothetical protein